MFVIKLNKLPFLHCIKNFKLELMEKFQFIQTSLFHNECKSTKKKKKEKKLVHNSCSVNDSPGIKITIRNVEGVKKPAVLRSM